MNSFKRPTVSLPINIRFHNGQKHLISKQKFFAIVAGIEITMVFEIKQKSSCQDYIVEEANLNSLIPILQNNVTISLPVPRGWGGGRMA